MREAATVSGLNAVADAVPTELQEAWLARLPAAAKAALGRVWNPIEIIVANLL